MKNRTPGIVGIPASIRSLPKSYMALLAEFPLRSIKSAAEYDRAAKIIHRLVLRERRLDSGEEAYLEVLEVLVERFDDEQSSVDEEDMTPTEVLRVLVEQAGMSVTELGQLLGSKGAASELLSGKRKEPSKGQIAKLCARFKVDASAFLLKKQTPATAA